MAHRTNLYIRPTFTSGPGSGFSLSFTPIPLHNRSWICPLLTDPAPVSLGQTALTSHLNYRNSHLLDIPASPCCPLYSTRHGLLKNTNYLVCLYCLKRPESSHSTFSRLTRLMLLAPSCLPDLPPTYQVPATLTFSCFLHQDFCSYYSVFLGRSSSQAACLSSQVTYPLLGRSSP